MALIFLLLPPVLSSLVVIGDELAHPRGGVEAVAFGLVSCAEAPTLVSFGVASAFCSLVVAGEVLARRRKRAKVLIFDLAIVAKALVLTQ